LNTKCKRCPNAKKIHRTQIKINLGNKVYQVSSRIDTFSLNIG
jgi:tRNA-binding EMAP/Myf-like protein